MLEMKNYGFTPEELDFIFNYDIKYRMGLKVGRRRENQSVKLPVVAVHVVAGRIGYVPFQS